MKQSTNKLRFVAESQLAHIDPTILNFLLRRSHLANSEDVAALAKALLIEVLGNPFADDEGVDASDWSARITASVRKGEDEDDEFLVDGKQAEPFIPQEVRTELEGDLQRAAADLRKIRAMNQREIDKAYAVACEVRLRTTRELPEADWNVWLAEPIWTIEEAAALLFGRDPSDLNASAKNLPDWARSPFEAMVKRLRRHVEVGEFKKGLTPKAVKQWLINRDPAAAAALDWVNGAKAAEATAADDKDAGTHTIDAFYRMILFVAVAHYGYDVEKARKASGLIEDPAGGVGHRSIPTRMMHDLNKAGVKISAKSLSKHLRNSLKLVRGPEPKVNVAKLTKVRKVES